jgi:hypothetical protein
MVMDERLKHPDPDMGIAVFSRRTLKRGRVEIAVYEDGTVKKLDPQVKGGFLEWKVDDVAKFIERNRRVLRCS